MDSPWYIKTSLQVIIKQDLSHNSLALVLFFSLSLWRVLYSQVKVYKFWADLGTELGAKFRA